MALNRGLFSSDSPDHYTPEEIIERVLGVLGEIDLDPCSNPSGNPVIPARAHYTVRENGLSLPWSGRIYLNPPYGREIGLWIDKLRSEWDSGNIRSAIALLPARPDTAWFRRLYGFPVCFVHGRLKFRDRHNRNQGSAPFPSVLVYLGGDMDSFFSEFETIGSLYYPVMEELWIK